MTSPPRKDAVPAARALPDPPRPRSAWIVSDGKAGDEMQCLGIVETLGLSPEIRRIAPRRPWAWMMPWGPVDPAEAPWRKAGPVSPPFPDLVIASGRRTVAYLRAIRRASRGTVFTAYLKDPRCGASAADFIWVPEHDRLRGANVFVTATSPHRVSADRLRRARLTPRAEIAALPRPRIAILIGGDSRRVTFSRGDAEALLRRARQIAGSGPHAFMVTTSRRTPDWLAESLRRALTAQAPCFWWQGGEPNPYIQFLANADRILVTGDSVNMVDEALASASPVEVFLPARADRRVRQRLQDFVKKGLIDLSTPAGCTHRLENTPRPPLDSTPTIAAAILDSYARHRAAHR